MEVLSRMHIQDDARCVSKPVDALWAQDTNRILTCLRSGPMTSLEIACTLRLTRTRIQAVLDALSTRHLIQAPRCVTEANGNQIALWELEDANRNP